MERSEVKKSKLLFVGAWCNPRTKRKLQAMALLSGRSQSAVLVDLIDAAPARQCPCRSSGGREFHPFFPNGNFGCRGERDTSVQ